MKGVKIDYKNDSRKNNIISSYLNGEKSSVIAKENNISKVTVIEFLRQNGFSDKVKRNVYSIFDEFFKHLDCVERAWVLGWIMADGCVYKRRLQVGLHKQDEDIIDKIMNYLSYKGVKNYYKNYVRFAVWNENITNDLKRYGCKERKSLVLQFPKDVKPLYLRHFVRGYFEGDGCVSMNKKRNYISIMFRGTFEFLSELKNVIKKELNVNSCMTKPKASKGKNTYGLAISGNLQSIKFLNWIYWNTEKEARLNRKFDKSKEVYDYMVSKKTMIPINYPKLNY